MSSFSSFPAGAASSSSAQPPHGTAASPSTPTAAQVGQAIDAMSNPHTPNDTRRAVSEQLESFVKSPAAWSVLDALITTAEAASEPGSKTPRNDFHVEFASLELSKKVAGDFGQLPPSPQVYASFKGALLKHISKFGAAVAAQLAAKPSSPPSGTDLSVLKHLCGAYASLLVHLRLPPKAAIAELCSNFSPPAGSLPLLLILGDIPSRAKELKLVALAREVEAAIGSVGVAIAGSGGGGGGGSSSSSPTYIPTEKEKRNSYRVALDSVGKDVLALLVNIMQVGMKDGVFSVFEKTFVAFAAWVGWCHLPGGDVASSPLLRVCLEAMGKFPALFLPACEAIHEIVDAYPYIAKAEHRPVTSILIPEILKMGPLFEGVASAKGPKAQEAALALARLFAAAGSRYIKFMILKPLNGTTPDPSWAEQRVAFLRLHNKVLAHHDSEVSGATFPFWETVVKAWREVLHEEQDEETYLASTTTSLAALQAAPQKPKWSDAVRAQLSPVMMEIAPNILRRLRFPSPDVWDEWPLDKQDDFRHEYRYGCADVLLFTCALVGYRPILGALVQSLQQEHTAWMTKRAGKKEAEGEEATGWEGVEAALYAVRAICAYVPPTDTEFLPVVLGLLPTLPYHPELRATCYRIVGRFSGWLSAHTKTLPSVMDFVVGGGLCPRKGVTAAAGSPAGALPPSLASPPLECAARALADLARKSLPYLAPQLVRLPSVISLMTLQEEAYAEVITPFAWAVALSPPANAEAAIFAFAGPIVARLELFAKAPRDALTTSGADGLLASLLTNGDGIVERDQCRKIGISESTAEILWDAAASSGNGNVLPALPKVSSSFPAERMAIVCVKSLLHKLALFLRSCVPDEGALMEMAGIAAPPTGASQKDWVKYREEQRERLAAAERGIRVPLLKLMQASFGSMSALWTSMGARGESGGGAGGEVLGKLAAVWDIGMERCGPLFQPMLVPILQLIGAQLSSPSPSCQAPWLLRKIIESARDTSADLGQVYGVVNAAIGAVMGLVTTAGKAGGGQAGGGSSAASSSSSSPSSGGAGGNSGGGGGAPLTPAQTAAAINAHHIFLTDFYYLARRAVSAYPVQFASLPNAAPLVAFTVSIFLPHGPPFDAAEPAVKFLTMLPRVLQDASAAATNERNSPAQKETAAACVAAMQKFLAPLIERVIHSLVAIVASPASSPSVVRLFGFRDKHRNNHDDRIQETLYEFSGIAPQLVQAALAAACGELTKPTAPATRGVATPLPPALAQQFLATVFPRGGAGSSVWAGSLRALHEAVGDKGRWDILAKELAPPKRGGGGGGGGGGGREEDEEEGDDDDGEDKYYEEDDDEDEGGAGGQGDQHRDDRATYNDDRRRGPTSW